MFWIFLIIVVLLFLWIGSVGAKQQAIKETEMKQQGFLLDQKVPFSKYLSGHPDIDNPVENIFHIPSTQNNDLHLFFVLHGKVEKQGSIPTAQIKNVSIEDASTMEKRVTVGRLLVLGIFAFAARKTVKNELSYLVIEWNDGRFDHETVFEFQGKDAAPRSHGVKNAIMRLMRK